MQKFDSVALKFIVARDSNIKNHLRRMERSCGTDACQLNRSVRPGVDHAPGKVAASMSVMCDLCRMNLKQSGLLVDEIHAIDRSGGWQCNARSDFGIVFGVLARQVKSR